MKLSGLILLTYSLSALGETLTLKEFDQIKLGELLGRIPATLVIKTNTPISGNIPGYVSKITFPNRSEGFQINCSKTYYNGSPYPSSTLCSVTIDPAHPQYSKSYDEIRFHVIEPDLVKAIFFSIPYGDTLKEYYSWERDAGSNFEGQRSDIFHYRFECTIQSCLVRFSGITPM